MVKSSHKEQVEKLFSSQRKSQNLSKLVDDNNNNESLSYKKMSKIKKNDHQYESMLNDLGQIKNGISDDSLNKYNDKLFKGKKISKKDLYEEIDVDEINEGSNRFQQDASESEEDTFQNRPIKNQFQADEMNLDDVLDEMDQQQNEYSVKQKETQNSEIQKSIQTKNQLQLWKKTMSGIIHAQKPMDICKRLPCNPIAQQFLDRNLHSSQKMIEILILQIIDELISNQQISVSKSSNTNLITHPHFIDSLKCQISQQNIQQISFMKEQQIDLNYVWDQINQNQNALQPWIEESINRWSQKTHILTQNVKKTGLQNIMHTPIGQATRAMENIDKLLLKSQLKRDQFRVMGRSINDLENEFDENIYDDAEFYQELLKDYMTEFNDEEEEDQEYLQDSTQRMLLQRKLRNQVKKAKKQVDRKSSKNRKLRYHVQTKIVNFMNPIQNTLLFEGRDELLQSICKYQYQSNHNNTQINHEKMDIQLF